MSDAPLVSVVVLTKNAGPSFHETLDALLRQHTSFPFEVLVLDSGSIDATVEEAARRGFRVHRIHPAEFDHGQTRNLGAALARGSVVAFLVQDALPANESWLETLTDAMRTDPSVAGTYGRVLPRSDAHPLLRRSILAEPNASEAMRVQRLSAGERFIDLGPEDRRMRANFNNVSSAVRKSVWGRLLFQRGQFAEDLGFGRAALEAGFAVVFEPKSVVFHSHDYGAREIFHRTVADGRANREIIGRTCIESIPGAIRHAVGQVREDWRYLRGCGIPPTSRVRAVSRSPALRAAEAFGLYVGSRRAHAHANGGLLGTALEERPLRVLLVVHGFPPETRAGTEVYTIELAEELRRRGHHVAIFHRTSDRSKSNYSLDVDRWNGFPVYRITNHLEYAGISETYRNEAVEEKFGWVLRDALPDVVHFQHALHLSTRCLRLARDSGAAVIVTLHDYWFICPKVQLIRPDRSVCQLRRPGLGCLVCSGGQTAPIRIGKWLTPLVGPALRLALRTRAMVSRRTPRFDNRLLNDAVALERRTSSILEDLQAAHLLVSPSPFLRDRYVEHGIPAERIVVCRNGIRTRPLRAVVRTPSDRLRIAFTGSLVWWKGLEVLVDAFNRLPPGRAVLGVHGDHEGNDAVREYHRGLVERIRVDGVQFHGGYAGEELTRIYRDVDVLVVPSLWFENSPLAVQEAHAAKVPVVASRLGALPGLVRDEVDGLLFEPGDADDLARVLRRLIDEPMLLERLRREIPAVKDVEEHVTEMLLFYRQFVGRNPSMAQGAAAFPAAEIWAPEHRRHEGIVRRQGRDLVLLVPAPTGRAGVAYDFELDRDTPCRIDVETEILEGESGVVLGGALFVGGKAVGDFAVHRYESGEPLRRVHSFSIGGRSGRNRIWITNATERDPTLGRHHLRIRRILVFTTTHQRSAAR
ncbi:MAG: glycosyltransferase [Planctomycetes bacterium]|nr:glycosyltransferase [Planctomycetota bacterium]